MLLLLFKFVIVRVIVLVLVLVLVLVVGVVERWVVLLVSVNCQCLRACVLFYFNNSFRLWLRLFCCQTTLMVLLVNRFM